MQTDISTTVLTAGDGGRFAVTRLGQPGSHNPVVLIPGLFTGRRFWLSDKGVGLAAHLAARGFGCWIVERRGIGASRITEGGRARTGLDEHLRHDLPALQRHIAESDDRPAFLIGHSFGGVLAARAAAETLDRDRLAGLVLLAAQCEVGLRALTPPASHLLRAAATLTGRFPARRLGLGSDDEPAAALTDACAWVTGTRRSGGFLPSLTRIRVPALGLVGAGDRSDPPEGCRRFLAHLSGADTTFRIAGRGTGFARDYGHAGLVVDPAARAEIWPLVTDWLLARAA
ncbi:MAG TPA: alpha/beta fold hydrolase [Nocardia sp.]|uniref:alpha/beta fold hydrolase n=1 Tax=Nocardia TaxID=1817 RepID=UPI002455CEAE|nr:MULTISPECIES: alpha/beta fold hydrolase [Nocardia]HLS79723.1 alpha/beta fold hydrolase [Nocardia sp.]